MSNLDSLEGSALEVPLKSFVRANSSRFNTQITQGYLLLSTVFLLFISDGYDLVRNEEVRNETPRNEANRNE